MNLIINKINYIKCLYEIKTEDVEKEMQLMCKYFGDPFGEKIRYKNNEITNEIKIIINGEIKSNILKYKFKKE